MHFLIYLVLPQEVYSGGSIIVEYYIKKILEKYHTEYMELSYILYTKDDIKELSIKESKSIEECINNLLDDSSDSYLDKKGNIISTRTKNPYYDWYEIGGRWNGELNKIKIAQEDNKDDNKEDLKSLILNNSCKINTLLKQKLNTVTICDKNGIIHTRSNEKYTYDILKEYLDDYVIAIDCHA